MNDFLTNLAARSRGVTNVVQPRPLSMFEPADAHEARPPKSFAAEQRTTPPEPPHLPTVDFEVIDPNSRTKASASSPRESSSQVFVRSVEREELRPRDVLSQRAITPAGTNSGAADRTQTPVRSTTSDANVHASASKPATIPSAADIDVAPHGRTPPRSPSLVEITALETPQRSHNRPPSESRHVTASTDEPVGGPITAHSDPAASSPASPQPQPLHTAIPESAHQLRKAGTAVSGPPLEPAGTAVPPTLGRPQSVALAASMHAAPTVQVTIGRIDVRAVSAAAETTPAKKTRREPALSLDEYARQRSGVR